MSGFRIPFGEWITLVIDWLMDVLDVPFDVLSTVVKSLYKSLELLLIGPPFWLIATVLVATAGYLKGWKLALGTAIGLAFILSVGLWENAMSTLVLVLIASLIALLIAIPLGILAARNDTASQMIRPVLDFLQTMPGFVYLVPALMMFGVGVVPGIVATIIFAVAPGVRLTELGIRGVNQEVIEAGYAFGSTPDRVLFQIQLPLAMPSIMAGVNQVIMMSLSMVVLAGMVGAGGLGGDVVEALARINIGLGFEAGLSVVILAMILDRTTGIVDGRLKKVRKARKAASRVNA